MTSAKAVEQHSPRETAVQRLVRQSGEFTVAATRLGLLTALAVPFLLIAFLTIDIPMRGFDWLAGSAAPMRPSNWMTWGMLIMAGVPFLNILIARKFGGDEAGRIVTAAWGVAAIFAFAEFSYLAPELESGDMPTARFVMAFVAAAMLAQYVGASLYDVVRGGDQWWRAPLYGALGAAAAFVLVYFPWVYWGTAVPWASWMVGDFTVKTVLAFAFLPIYGMLRDGLRPIQGYGGR